MILLILVLVYTKVSVSDESEKAPASNIDATLDLNMDEDTSDIIGFGDFSESDDNADDGDFSENVTREYESTWNGSDDNEEDLIDLSEYEDYQVSYTDDELVDFDQDNAFEYCSEPECLIDALNSEILFNFDMTGGIPLVDDEYIYLFEVATWEDESLTEKEPVAAAPMDISVTLTCRFRTARLFSRFVPAVLYHSEYVPISDGKFVTNPEIIADNTEDYPETESKKGLLIDAGTLGSELLTDLNIKKAVFNVPLSYIMGETEDEAFPTIEYEYCGVTYLFNGYRCALFDTLFRYFTDNGYQSTAIILNDWNVEHQEIIHPKARRKTASSMYYAFNTEEEDGVRLIEACALFLAQRYSGGEHGFVSDWIIANEINQQKVWNYMATSDLEYYTESFEKGFRIFYNAMKSAYSNAKVYYSIDQDWNNNYGFNGGFFNGRDILYTFNKYAKKGGDYDWGLSIHPYPSPLTRTRFWDGKFDKTEDARVVTPMNLTVVTDAMQKDELLNTQGQVRDIGVTELGFSSRAGEQMQAAAFAYCYYIIEDNEYINSFLMNRQTDDAQSLKSGLSLGLYNKDHSPKYLAEVFKNIDSPDGDAYIEEMLSIIGADSLEEALERAR